MTERRYVGVTESQVNNALEVLARLSETSDDGALRDAIGRVRSELWDRLDRAAGRSPAARGRIVWAKVVTLASVAALALTLTACGSSDSSSSSAKPEVPAACRTALSASEDVRRDAVAFSSLMEKEPPLLLAAYKAGISEALGDDSGTQDVLARGKIINGRIADLTDRIRPHVRAYLSAREKCLGGGQ